MVIVVQNKIFQIYLHFGSAVCLRKSSTGRASPPPSRVSSASFSNRVTTVGAALPPLVGKAKPPINVVGDVNGRVAIMVDDMIDDVKSFIDAAHILKERGAYKIYALATHGILSADAPRLIQESPIDEVFILRNI